MMDVALVDKMIRNNWNNSIKDSWQPWTTGAKFVTGVIHIDAYLHYLESEAGISLKLSDNITIDGFDVLNEEKFLMFALRWS